MPFCVLGRLCRNIGIKEKCLYCGTKGKAQKAKGLLEKYVAANQ